MDVVDLFPDSWALAQSRVAHPARVAQRSAVMRSLSTRYVEKLILFDHVAARLVQFHEPDLSGHCCGCSPTRPQAERRWPCATVAGIVSYYELEHGDWGGQRIRCPRCEGSARVVCDSPTVRSDEPPRLIPYGMCDGNCPLFDPHAV